MRETIFRAAVVLLLSLSAFFLYLHSENGRYQFVKTDQNGIVLDTRTGEYWIDAQIHINPKTGKVDRR